METNITVAGPELNDLVAEKVMGWKPVLYPGGTIYWDEGGKFAPRFSGSFRPSTDWAHAGEVLEKMRTRGFWCVLDAARFDGSWKVRFFDCEAEAATGPLAICLAAIKAV